MVAFRDTIGRQHLTEVTLEGGGVLMLVEDTNLGARETNTFEHTEGDQILELTARFKIPQPTLTFVESGGVRRTFEALVKSGIETSFAYVRKAPGNLIVDQGTALGVRFISVKPNDGNKNTDGADTVQVTCTVQDWV